MENKCTTPLTEKKSPWFSPIKKELKVSVQPTAERPSVGAKRLPMKRTFQPGSKDDLKPNEQPKALNLTSPLTEKSPVKKELEGLVQPGAERPPVASTFQPKDSTKPSEQPEASSDPTVIKAVDPSHAEEIPKQSAVKRSLEEVMILSEPECKKPCQEDGQLSPCFLCGELVEDSGLCVVLPPQLDPPTESVPAVLTLGCGHLVHTVCIAYRYYITDKMQCPLCEAQMDYDNCTHIHSYVYHGYIEQTKLLEFIRQPLFQEGPREPKNFLFRKVNAAIDIDFEEDKEAKRWPPFKSNEFVRGVLKHGGYDSNFLKKVAAFVVSKHKCDERCVNCGYRDVSKMSADELQERIDAEHHALVERHGMQWEEEEEDDLPNSPESDMGL